VEIRRDLGPRADRLLGSMLGDALDRRVAVPVPAPANAHAVHPASPVKQMAVLVLCVCPPGVVRVLQSAFSCLLVVLIGAYIYSCLLDTDI
jgi:hypothetical protein